jgi:hypothetical protein
VKSCAHERQAVPAPLMAPVKLPYPCYKPGEMS